MYIKMLKNISNALLHSHKGQIVISIILGLGLASLFRKVCNDRNCLIFQAPSIDEVSSTTYTYADKCYNFKPKAMKCGTMKKQVLFS
jgi:hypothetical protein